MGGIKNRNLTTYIKKTLIRRRREEKKSETWCRVVASEDVSFILAVARFASEKSGSKSRPSKGQELERSFLMRFFSSSNFTFLDAIMQLTCEIFFFFLFFGSEVLSARTCYYFLSYVINFAWRDIISFLRSFGFFFLQFFFFFCNEVIKIFEKGKKYIKDWKDLKCAKVLGKWE